MLTGFPPFESHHLIEQPPIFLLLVPSRITLTYVIVMHEYSLGMRWERGPWKLFSQVAATEWRKSKLKVWKSKKFSASVYIHSEALDIWFIGWQSRWVWIICSWWEIKLRFHCIFFTFSINWWNIQCIHWTFQLENTFL